KQKRRLENSAASGPFFTRIDARSDLRHRARQRFAVRGLSRSRDRQDALATHSGARALWTAAKREWSSIAEPGHRRKERLRVLPGIWDGLVRSGRQRALETAAWAIQHVLRLWGVANPRRRQSDPACRSGSPSVVLDRS